MKPYVYNAVLVRAVDGDTYDIDVDLGFKLTQRIRVHLYGIDCSELNSTDPVERACRARDWVQNRFGGMPIRVNTIRPASFGRWEARVCITLEEGWSCELADLLIAEGFAKTKTVDDGVT